MKRAELPMWTGMVCVRAAAAGLMVASGVAWLAGCRAQPQAVGETPIEAEYVFGTLRAELPPTVGVLRCLDAAEVSLRGRGFVIAERSASADAGVVLARQGGTTGWDTVRVEARHRSRGTEVAVFTGPMGDEVKSRVLMESIVTRLVAPEAGVAMRPVP